MRDKNRAVLGDADDIAAADRFVGERIEGARRCPLDLRRLCSFGHFKLPEHPLTVREPLSGLGEATSAHNLLLRLRRPGETGRAPCKARVCPYVEIPVLPASITKHATTQQNKR